MSESAYENIDQHLSDAKAVARAIQNSVHLPRRILDLGSGVGLPGVVISILLPDTTVILAERRRRRGAFLEIARSQLDLRNTEVFLGDVRHLGGENYEVITALAFGALTKIYNSTLHLHTEDITIISRKSADWTFGFLRMGTTGLTAQVEGCFCLSAKSIPEQNDGPLAFKTINLSAADTFSEKIS